MITRKVVQHGSSTLTISLPYKWTNQIGLSKGDTILLVQRGNDLLLTGDVKYSNNSIVLKFSNKKPFLKRYLINVYREGYSEVILDFDGQIPFSDIVMQLEELLGFEIVKQSESQLVIRDIASIKHDELNTMIKRLFILAREFLKNRDELAIEKEINKVANYCLRGISSNEPSQISKYATIIGRLEQIGDACKHLSSRNPDIDLIMQIDDYFENIIIEFGKDLKNLDSLKKKRLALIDKIKSMKPTWSTAFLWQIIDNLHHIEISM